MKSEKDTFLQDNFGQSELRSMTAMQPGVLAKPQDAAAIEDGAQSSARDSLFDSTAPAETEDKYAPRKKTPKQPNPSTQPASLAICV